LLAEPVDVADLRMNIFYFLLSALMVWWLVNLLGDNYVYTSVSVKAIPLQAWTGP
jgi:hypothetical protein